MKKKSNSFKPTKEEKLLALAQYLKLSAQDSLEGFILYHDNNYSMGWVHKEICDKLDQFLEDVKAKKSPRLIVCVPPRHGKSQIVSRYFPAYVFGRYPDMQIIATSYSADLAQRFNRDVQRIIDSQPYQEIFPKTTLNSTNVRTKASESYIRTSDLFEIVGYKGAYRSCGVGGGITGVGADILICDDLIKDRAEASSATIRKNIWEWYTSTAYTRLSPGGGVVIILTRWHQDDLVGRLINNMIEGTGDEFTVINYPAIAEKDEPHRKIGEALHPERYPLEQLEAIKKTIGIRDWESLYQQHPTPDGGAIFKSEWIRHWDPATLPTTFNKKVISWDMTFKDSKNSDFVVGQVWGKKDANFYLLDQVRGRWDYVKTREMFKSLSAKWQGFNRKLVEDKANGSAIIADLKRFIPGIIPITPKESKESRANAVTPFFEAGNVYLPPPAQFNWVNDFEAELLSFPSGTHDDMVDSCTMALGDLAKSKGFIITDEVARQLLRPYRG